MRARDLKLIDQIQADALDSDVSISDTLRKLIALGGEVGSTELREWASRELRGYGDISADDLPDYRKPSAVILVNAINGNYKIDGQQISPRQLPDPVNKHVSEEVPLWQGIGQIEAMVQQARGEGGYLKLTIPRSQDVAAIWNHDVHQGGNPYQNITAIYWNMSEVALRGVVDQVRTTLVELVAEMRAGMPDDVDNPSAAVADNAVQVAVYGDKARVNVTAATGDGAQVQNTAQSAGSNGGAAVHHTSSEKMSLWRKIGGGIVGVAVVATALITLALWQGWGL